MKRACGCQSKQPFFPEGEIVISRQESLRRGRAAPTPRRSPRGWLPCFPEAGVPPREAIEWLARRTAPRSDRRRVRCLAGSVALALALVGSSWRYRKLRFIIAEAPYLAQRHFLVVLPT